MNCHNVSLHCVIFILECVWCADFPLFYCAIISIGEIRASTLFTHKNRQKTQTNHMRVWKDVKWTISRLLASTFFSYTNSKRLASIPAVARLSICDTQQLCTVTIQGGNLTQFIAFKQRLMPSTTLTGYKSSRSLSFSFSLCFRRLQIMSLWNGLELSLCH